MTRVKKTIVLLSGDGIGPEVVRAAATLLKDCAERFGHQFTTVEYPIGGMAIDRYGTPLPPETLKACAAADAILLGAVGGPQWDSLPLNQRPESGLLELRQKLGLYVNLRPICLREPLRAVSPLKVEGPRKINSEIVRELSGGIYFGAHRVERTNGAERATDIETYSTGEVERVVRFAFERAAGREKRLASVDKANVLATSTLWRKTVDRVAQEYPGVSVEHFYVDNAAMQLMLRPEQFDVLVTSNLFGDILSDEAAALVGSIGLVPSMSCGLGPPLFEPIHGSAPSLMGKDSACPIGAILSSTMMLREAFGLYPEADWIESRVDRVLSSGYRTADIAEPDSTVVGCSTFVELVRSAMHEASEQLEEYGWGV